MIMLADAVPTPEQEWSEIQTKIAHSQHPEHWELVSRMSLSQALEFISLRPQLRERFIIQIREKYERILLYAEQVAARRPVKYVDRTVSIAAPNREIPAALLNTFRWKKPESWHWIKNAGKNYRWNA
jgi:hypothetical protein